MANAERVTRPIRGEARRVQLRTHARGAAGGGGGGSYDILTFVVDRFDEMGDRLTPIPVEMKGTIQGVLNDGDKVEIDVDWETGQTIQLQKLLNLTTGGMVSIPVAGGSSWILFVVLALFLLPGLIFLIYGLIQHLQGH
jgi:hypothetical protein